jgi:cell division protein FtsB
MWQRLNRVLFTLLFLAVWLGIISLFVPPYRQLQAARSELDTLQAQRDEQKMLLAHANRQVNWLKTDATYLETIARDRLDLMKEGEAVFRLETAPKKAPSH